MADTSWDAFVSSEANRWLAKFKQDHGGRNPTWDEVVAANLIEPAKRYVYSMTGLAPPGGWSAAAPPAATTPSTTEPAAPSAGVPAAGGGTAAAAGEDTTLIPGSPNFDPRAYYEEYPEMYAQKGLEEGGYTAGPFTRFLQGQVERPTSQYELLKKLREVTQDPGGLEYGKYDFPAGGTFKGPLEQFNWLLGGGTLDRSYLTSLADIMRRGGQAGARPGEIAASTYGTENPQDIWNYYRATQPRQFGAFSNWMQNQYGNIYGRFAREQAVPGGGTKSWIDYLLGR